MKTDQDQLPKMDLNYIRETTGLYLNLGCGPNWHAPEPWINIDLWSKANPDLLEDCTTLPSFEPDSVEEIVAGHILEHIPDMRSALSRWYEILKPGGSVVITVPEHWEAMKLWMKAQPFPNYHSNYVVGLYGALTGFQGHGDFTSRQDLDPISAQLLAHRRSFDTQTLEMVMERAGFINLEKLETHPAMPPYPVPFTWQVTIKGTKLPF